jgi:hypothetical protein
MSREKLNVENQKGILTERHVDHTWFETMYKRVGGYFSDHRSASQVVLGTKLALKASL